jgi:hypothetical protein
MVTFVAVVIALAIGFGAGRIKNAAKLAAIKAEVEKVFPDYSEAAKLAAAIKAKL